MSENNITKKPESEIEILATAIGFIAYALTTLQVFDEKGMYDILKNDAHNPNLTPEIYETALSYCDKCNVITGRVNGIIYQTNSLRNKKSELEMHHIIKSLVPQSVV